MSFSRFFTLLTLVLAITSAVRCGSESKKKKGTSTTTPTQTDADFPFDWTGEDDWANSLFKVTDE